VDSERNLINFRQAIVFNCYICQKGVW